MAYVTIHTLPGSAEELLTRKQSHFDPVVQRVAPALGALFSVTAPTPDGLLIINVWEDAERVSAFTALPELQAAQAEAQLPPPSSLQRYPGAVLDVFKERDVPQPASYHTFIETACRVPTRQTSAPSRYKPT